MQNNDILKKLRYIFNWKDSEVVQIFSLTDRPFSKDQVIKWLSKDDQINFEEMTDKQLAIFLNGLIVHKRGKKEGATPPPIETSINNNVILRKLKIALNFKNEDVLAVLKKADLSISPHELSAFFRHPKQNQYRICKDQILRNFLMGLQLKYRG